MERCARFRITRAAKVETAIYPGKTLALTPTLDKPAVVRTVPPRQPLPTAVIDPAKPLLKLGLDVHLEFIMPSRRKTTPTRTPRASSRAPNSSRRCGSGCPESFLRDKSIGYVFVADGLSTKTAVEHSALVFFCPADSHQRSEQHCHAMLATGLTCLKSNAEMIALLRREIGRAKDGSVPYSTNALAQMQRELEARQRHETKRRT